MIFLYAITAVFIAWIWVDYYRLIDIYQSESLLSFLVTFFLGGASVFIVFGVHDLLPDLMDAWKMNGEILNDLIYTTVRIGALEEFAKAMGFYVAWIFFRKQIDEPIDFIAFFCVSALGFSAAENVLYFNNYGASIINSRAILSTVGHMFDTALIAYGVVLWKYRKQSILMIPLFFGFASLAHGIYDFSLMFRPLGDYGFIIALVYFMYSISFFAIILGNAVNNSSFFTYSKVISSKKVIIRIIGYYGILFIAQISLLLIEVGWAQTLARALNNFFLTSFIIVITVVRLSRFSLKMGHWHPFTFELPFFLRKGKIVIRGNYVHDQMHSLIHQKVELIPNALSSIRPARFGTLEDKFFSEHHVPIYIYVGEDGRAFVIRPINRVKNSMHNAIAYEKPEGFSQDDFGNLAEKEPIEVMVRLPEEMGR